MQTIHQNRPLELGNFIGGKKAKSQTERWLEVISPLDGKLLASVPMSERADLDAAVEAAKLVLPKWSKMPIKERVQVFFRYKRLLEDNMESLSQLICAENGKTMDEARAEIEKSIELTEFAFLGDIYEMSGLVEWNFLGKPAFSRNGIFARRVDPYLFIGGALASFNTTAKAPATTSPYPFPEKDNRNVTVALPIGGGIKFHLSEEFTLGIEYGNRFTASDYVDGISKTANATSKDWYMFGGLTLSYTIGNDPFIYNR